MQFAVSPAYFSVKYSKQQKIGKAVLVFPIFHSIGSMQAQAFSSSTTGQPRRRMASRSWVASKTGFSPQRSRSSAAAAARVSGSIPVKGSSNSNVSLAAHKARSRAVRRFCPPESRHHRRQPHRPQPSAQRKAKHLRHLQQLWVCALDAGAYRTVQHGQHH